MPIAHDATTTAEGSDISSLSWSHTTTGANRCLFGAAGIEEAVNLSRDVTEITYNAVALTEIGISNDDVAAIRTELWRLVAPATGANTITITFADLVSLAAGAASSYTGVDQTTPVDTWASATGSGDPATVNVASATDDLVIDTVVVKGDTAITVGAGQTSRWNNPFSDPGPVDTHAGSTEPGAGTVTMSWIDIGAGLSWVIGGVSINPAAAAGSVVSPRTFALLGVGS